MALQFDCELPSRGLLYGDRLPDGKLTISPMTTDDEKLLAGGVGDRTTLIDRILEKKIISKQVPYDELLCGDKVYLLIYLRAITYGADYSFRVKCRGCGNYIVVSIKIPEGLKVRQLDENDVEPFVVDLPVSKKTVGLRLMRVSDEKAVQKHLKMNSAKYSKIQGDPVYTLRMSKHLVSVDGEDVSPAEALSFCEELYGMDSLTITNTIDSHDCGVDLEIETECNICGFSSLDRMPFTNEFFRPKPQDLL